MGYVDIVIRMMEGDTTQTVTRGSCLQGDAGDWLASQVSDPQDIYIIKKRIFEKTYEKV